MQTPTTPAPAPSPTPDPRPEEIPPPAKSAPAKSQAGNGPAPSTAPAPTTVTETIAAAPASNAGAPANLEATWQDVLAEFNDLTSDSAGNYASLDLDGERLTITLKSAVDQTMCDRPGAKERLEEALKQKTGRNIRLDFKVSAVPEKKPPRPQHISRRQRIRNAEQNEFVKLAMDMLDGEITDV
ncbi:MAG: hypothetical protein GY883_24675, partial [Shimia sp.]|nr:hypothetical protein [Shimia sp.]